MLRYLDVTILTVDFIPRSGRTLANNAPAPFVYLGLLCAILAGLCFTSRFVKI